MTTAQTGPEAAAEHELRWVGDCAVFTIRRTRRLNALTKDGLESLSAAIDAAEARRADALIVVGEGEKAFCAGTDLAELQSMAPEAAERKTRFARGLLDRLHRSTVPSVAAVNGLAFGGGLELALACTFRVAAPHATFAMPEIKLAVLPSYGGTQLLPAIVGQARALDMMLTGRTVDCAEAVAMGLVTRVARCDQGVLSRDALVEQALEFARTFTCYSKPAIEAIRHCVRASGPVVDEAGLATEALEAEKLKGNHDAREGVQAFLEKRPPKFLHR